MKIYTNVDSIARSIQQDIARERDLSIKTGELRKEPEDSLEISRENVVASRVRLEDAAAASRLLEQIQAQITNQPNAAIFAQANIVVSNVINLVVG